MRMLIALGLLAVALASAGCGGSEGDGATVSSPNTTERKTTTTTPAPPPEEVHKGTWALLKRAAGKRADRLLLPQGPAPRKVLVRDLKPGNGPVVQRGDWITVAYKGFSYVTGRQTLEQWGEAAFSWTYGVGELFYGLEPGLEGMRVGGVRELVAPSRLTHETGAMVLYVALRKAEAQ
jgi:FKBP-type peptidyl-prolyl cis-trans isomerase